MKKISLSLLLIFICIAFSSITRANKIAGFYTDIDIPFLSGFIHHTYSCIYNLDYCQAFGPSGLATIKGGRFMNNGWFPATMDQVAIAYCRSRCFMIYGFDGVCHQHTNRVLSAIDLEIQDNWSIKGYHTTKDRFGARGKNFNQCKCY